MEKVIEFYIDKNWDENRIVDKVFDQINEIVDRPNSEMIGDDCIKVTLEWFKDDEV